MFTDKQFPRKHLYIQKPNIKLKKTEKMPNICA